MTRVYLVKAYRYTYVWNIVCNIIHSVFFPLDFFLGIRRCEANYVREYSLIKYVISSLYPLFSHEIADAISFQTFGRQQEFPQWWFPGTSIVKISLCRARPSSEMYIGIIRLPLPLNGRTIFVYRQYLW